MRVFAAADTIAAIATPPGRGGIGIVRVSGTNLDARLGRGGVRQGGFAGVSRRWLGARGEIGLGVDFALYTKDGFANFAAPVIDDRRLPIAAVLFQLLQHGTGKTQLGQGRLELIVALHLFRLLRGHVGFEEDLGRVNFLGEGSGRQREKRDDGEEKQQPEFVHRQAADDSRRVRCLQCSPRRGPRLCLCNCAGKN